MVFRVIHSRSRYWPLLALCGHEALAAMERIRMCVTCDRHRTALAPPFAAAVSLHWAGAAQAGMWHERSLLAVEGALLEESDEATDEEADEAER